MNYYGLLVGVISFLTIGVFHPIVIKCQYYFTDKVWPVFLVCGIIACVGSLFIKNDIVSAIVSVVGFSSFWSIHELKQQTKRVEKGWFPDNPNRKFGKKKKDDEK